MNDQEEERLSERLQAYKAAKKRVTELDEGTPELHYSYDDRLPERTTQFNRVCWLKHHEGLEKELQTAISEVIKRRLVAAREVAANA